MGVTYFRNFWLFLALLSVSAQGSEEQIEPANAGIGFELVQNGWKNLQYSFMELFVHVKELGEMVRNNQRSIEQSQSRTNQMLDRHQKQIVDRVDDLERGYSKEILDLQTICANHDIIKKKLSETKVYESCTSTGSTESGLFNISIASGQLEVFCELKDFGGGWLVIQQRMNGAVNFYRNWTEFKNGFGIVGEEFWIGLDIIHEITNSGTFELVIELRDFAENYAYARYSHFVVGDEFGNFKLENLGEFSGTAKNSLRYNLDMMFSTFDNDNDAKIGCANLYEGAWWYGGENCFFSNLNGKYRNATGLNCITWFTRTAMKYTRMMIKVKETS